MRFLLFEAHTRHNCVVQWLLQCATRLCLGRCGLPCPVHVLYFVVARRDLDTGEVLFVLRNFQGPYALHDRCRRQAEVQRGLVFIVVRTPAVGGA